MLINKRVSYKDKSLKLRDSVAILFMVYLLYELMWGLTYSRFGVSESVFPELWLELMVDFATCSIFSLTSMLFFSLSERYVRCVIGIERKIISFTSGVLVFNILVALILVMVENNVLDTMFGIDDYLDLVDVYLLSLLFTLMVSVLMAVRYVRAYLAEKEALHSEMLNSAEVKLKNLELQINPHFMFNSLSTLSALIYEDPVAADRFLTHLSKIYRHSVQNIDRHLITLNEEINNLQDYIYLLTIRYGEAIRFNFKVNAEDKKLSLPPGSLQMLVENAVKHNRFSNNRPLNVEISACDAKVTVRSDYRPLTSDTAALGVGHKIISDRYTLLSAMNMYTTVSEGCYIVQLPLITDNKQ